jgi:hypothetical protein
VPAMLQENNPMYYVGKILSLPTLHISTHLQVNSFLVLITFLLLFYISDSEAFNLLKKREDKVARDFKKRRKNMIYISNNNTKD